MSSTQLGFNKVLISSSISQPATNDIIAEQAELLLLLLPHKEQQTVSALHCSGLRQRMCTQNTAEEHGRTCRQTVHICC